MVGVEFMGRLGNQMFTYAFARVIMEQCGEKTFTANFKRCGHKKETGDDGLSYFNVLPFTTVDYDIILRKGSMLQQAAYLIYVLLGRMPVVGHSDKFMSYLERWLRKVDIHITGAADPAYRTHRTKKSIFIRGYFQDKLFFDDIRPVLLREFTPILPPLEHNKALYKASARPGSVCVHVRRGDFLSNIYKKDFYVCTPEYFQKAIRVMCQRVKNPCFIFFSDDIEWVRKHLYVDGYPCFYERGNDPAWEIMRLMSSCNHFVISNSTFAWWASYLGEREDKIIITPEHWYANPKWHSNLPGGDEYIRLTI